MKRAAILAAATDCVCRDRAKTHGDAEDNFRRIAGHWTWWLQSKLQDGAVVTPADVAQMMVGFKQARTMGNPTHMDSFTDQCGYSALAGEIAAKACQND